MVSEVTHSKTILKINLQDILNLSKATLKKQVLAGLSAVGLTMSHSDGLCTEL